METTLQNLLTQASAITKKYDKIAENTGENFNVFRILKVESSEVHTHSAFLAELLNPQGSHGQKDTFLKIFINLFKFHKYAFKTQDATAKVEKYTGVINDKYTEGGRIDIIITDKSNRHIIIENKIYHGDERNQLIRYHNFDPSADLFYLTLYGDEPSDWSKGEKLHSGNEFKTISYHTDIINWLKLCHKETVVHPILRETITQYINLIKYLTGQTINNKMEKEISTILSKPDNIESTFAIYFGIHQVKQKLMKEFINQASEIAKELNLEFNKEGNLWSKNDGFYYYRENWKYCAIGFAFDRDGAFDFYYGIRRKDMDIKIPPEIIKILIEKLKLMNDGTNEKWPRCKWFEIRQWGIQEPWIQIAKGSMQKKIKNIVKEIIEQLEGVEL